MEVKKEGKGGEGREGAKSGQIPNFIQYNVLQNSIIISTCPSLSQNCKHHVGQEDCFFISVSPSTPNTISCKS